MKRTGEATHKEGKAPRLDSPYCFKLLVPPPLAVSMLGQKGSTIQQIQTDTQTTIKFSNRTMVYPGTNSRIGTVWGGSLDNLKTCAQIFVDYMEHVVSSVSSESNGTGQNPNVDTSDLCPSGQPGNYRLIMVTP